MIQSCGCGFDNCPFCKEENARLASSVEARELSEGLALGYSDEVAADFPRFSSQRGEDRKPEKEIPLWQRELREYVYSCCCDF